MGLFDLFKKNKPQKDSKEPLDTMLTLEERQAPVKKDENVVLEESGDSTGMPVLARKISSHTDHLLDESEGHASIGKSRESLPHVQKLSIPSAEETLASQSTPQQSEPQEQALKQVSFSES